MNSYGIQGKLIKWFQNYLFKRRQKGINKNSWGSKKNFPTQKLGFVVFAGNKINFTIILCFLV
jgi:hypothetical protein